MLMSMMVTLMLTMMNVGILLERARKGTYRDAGTAAGPCSAAGAAGNCDPNRLSPHRSIRGRGQIHWKPRAVNHV
jgi:hypothetical protein